MATRSRKFVSVAQDNQNAPEQVGVYRLEEEIGSGAMGKVYRATHGTLGKQVALKLVHADDPSGEVAARFLQEGVAASRVRHPNVVEVLDAGSHEGRAYMAMQLLEGETLASCLSRQGRIPQTYAVDLILPVCAALVAAHNAGVLHRDLKPANIFLADVGRGDPEPILLDFGISKILGPVDPELTQNPRFLGSPLYIAPEQADGAPGSPRSDQYSLALTLYEALLGVRPFAKYSSSLIQLLRHVAEGDIRRPRDLDASIPDELDQAISRALSTDPQRRFGSVREFGAAILPFASQARRTLWQQSFIDAERTMTSANAPVSDSDRSSKRVQVSVESSRPDPHAAETHFDSDAPDLPEPRGDFLSHSSLFGEESENFDAAQSSISRKDPFSQIPSDRASGAWSDEAGTHHSLQRPTLTSDEPKQEQGSSRRSLVLLAVALIVVALVAALRPWATSEPEKYQIIVSVSPSTAQIEVDAKPVGQGTFAGYFLNDGDVHKLRVSHKGYESQTLLFKDPTLPQTIVLTADKSQLVDEPSAPKVDDAPSVEQKPAAAAPPNADAPRPKSPPRRIPAKPKTPPSDPAPEAVTKSPEPDAPKTPKKPSIQTGNLDPWAN